MHEFHAVAEVRDCVDVVCGLVGHGRVFGVMCWRGCDGETPETCDWVASSGEEVALAIIEVACVASIAENSGGKKG